MMICEVEKCKKTAYNINNNREQKEKNMFDRKLYKKRGKEAFQRNYWMCVVAALIIALLCDGMITAVFSAKDAKQYVPQISERINYTENNGAELNEYRYEYENNTRSTANSGLWFVLGIFVFGVMNIGGRRFFINNRYGNGQLNDLFAYFKDGNYLEHVWTMFALKLQVALWSLLLVVPGIIKGYEYYMVPYIAAENPGMKKKEVFALSRQITTGHKWELFVFDLSFLGWGILSALTANILGVLYVFPYKKAAGAEVYHALRNGLDNP